ncbi:MAG: NUDIX hydrolase [Actinomycetota bacterium]
MNDYEVIGSKSVFNGEVLKVRVDEVRMPSGKIVEREVITHGGAVGIIPVTDDNKIILVEQYRHAVDKMLLEIPAGKLDPGETPEDCARRELIEETGQAPGRLIPISSFFTSPGYSNEIFHLYAAEDLSVEVADEPEEEIVGTVDVTVAEAIKMIDDGRIEDGKTIAAIGMIKIYLEAGGSGREK